MVGPGRGRNAQPPLLSLRSSNGLIGSLDCVRTVVLGPPPAELEALIERRRALGSSARNHTLMPADEHRDGPSSASGTLGVMPEREKLVTAEELDTMTPDQRAAVVRDSIVTDWDDVPADFRRKVEATAGHLAASLERPTAE